MILKLSLPILATASLLMTSAVDARPKGPVNIDEFEARITERFHAADADSNGEISAEEFAEAKDMRPHGRKYHRAGRGGPRGHEGGPRDWDDETRAEVEAELFQTLDRNSDGNISSDEFSMQALRQSRQAVKRSRAFAHLDANNDGVLTRDELPNPAARMRAADTDGDGVLTRAERRAARAGG